MGISVPLCNREYLMHRYLLSGICAVPVQLQVSCTALCLAIPTYRSLFLGVLVQATHTHRNLLLGILVQPSTWLCISAAGFTHSQEPDQWRVYWCSSAAGYTCTQEPALGRPSVALLQATSTSRYLRPFVLVQLCCQLYIHTKTYSWVFSYTPVAGYTYTRNLLLSFLVQLCGRIHTLTGPAPGYPGAAVLQNIWTYWQEPTLGYHGVALLQVIHTHGNLLFGILVSSAASDTYTQEPTLRYHGAALLPVIHMYPCIIINSSAP